MFPFMSQTTSRGHLWKVSVYRVKYLPIRIIDAQYFAGFALINLLSPVAISSMLSRVDWPTYNASNLKGVSQVEKKNCLRSFYRLLGFLSNPCHSPPSAKKNENGVCTRDWSLHLTFWRLRSFFKMCFGTHSNSPLPFPLTISSIKSVCF